MLKIEFCGVFLANSCDRPKKILQEIVVAELKTFWQEIVVWGNFRIAITDLWLIVNQNSKCRLLADCASVSGQCCYGHNNYTYVWIQNAQIVKKFF